MGGASFHRPLKFTVVILSQVSKVIRIHGNGNTIGSETGYSSIVKTVTEKVSIDSAQASDLPSTVFYVVCE